MIDTDVCAILEKMGCRKIKPSGNNLVCTCPFETFSHKDGKDTEPSFSIRTGGENPWQCFACHQRGRTIFSLARNFESLSGRDLGIPTGDLSKQLFNAKKNYSVSIMKDFDNGWCQEEKMVPFNIEDYKDLFKSIPNYALERGITLEQAHKWRLGYDQVSQRLFIPVFNFANNFVGWSKRGIFAEQKPKYLHAPGMRRNNLLYGENFINRDIPFAFLSEGFMDVYAMDRAGLDNCLASFGTACSPVQVDRLSQFKTVYIFPHNDAPGPDGTIPGMVMANRFAVELRKRQVKVILVPSIPNKKDVGEWTTDEIHSILSNLEHP